MSEAKLFPVVKADEPEEEEDMVDPQQELRYLIYQEDVLAGFYPQVSLDTSKMETCAQKPDAQSMFSKYQQCNDRVNSRTKTAETCEEELVDYLHVLDKCVTKDLFKRLK